MQKAASHLIILAASFFGLWFLLSRIDFMDIFHVEQLTKENERKLGGLILDVVTKHHEELDSDDAVRVVENMKKRICEANEIADSGITIHIVVQDDVNAFALPDRHLIIYTGLIEYCDSAGELAGVIAHEIAHIEHRHVTKKLVKEIGMVMLSTIAGGKASGEIARQTAKLLSSTAFDREQESEADSSAVRYMANAQIDPEHFANILFRLSKEKKDIPKQFEWVSTHPNSSDRAAEILELRNNTSITPRPIVDSAAWSAYKKFIRTTEEE